MSGTEAARVQPDQPRPPAHDACTRRRHRLAPDPATRWQEAAPLVAHERGVLVRDDSTLDKPYARKLGLVPRHWSGKHRRVVQGSTLLTLRWTDGEALIPGDDRRDEQAVDRLSKHDHCQALLATAAARGVSPEAVVCDSWYASLDNLTQLRRQGWRWLTRLKANRLVNPAGAGNRPLGECAIAGTGTRVHLHGSGFVLVFRIVTPDGDTESWATDDLALTELQRRKYAEFAWGSEGYHRGLKPPCGVARAEARAARAQRHHIGCVSRALLRLEQHRLVTGVSW